MGQASGDGLALVEHRIRPHVEHLVTGSLLPARDTSSVQVDLIDKLWRYMMA